MLQAMSQIPIHTVLLVTLFSSGLAAASVVADALGWVWTAASIAICAILVICFNIISWYKAAQELRVINARKELLLKETQVEQTRLASDLVRASGAHTVSGPVASALRDSIDTIMSNTPETSQVVSIQSVYGDYAHSSGTYPRPNRVY